MDTYNICKLIPHGSFSIYKRIPIDTWSPDEVAKKIDLRDYIYLYFETKEMSIVPSELGVTYVCKTIKSSNKYYINAYVETLDDIKARRQRKDNSLIDRMKNLNWTHVVQCIDPEINWKYQFNLSSDKLITVEGQLVEV